MTVPKLPVVPDDPLLGAPDDAWATTVIRDIAVGRSVGEYVIRRRIGVGGMGIVYEAEHPQIGRRVAIKVLRPELGAHRGLLDEARTASAVRHRHIIDVFGFGELQGLGQYLVMDFLEGVPLDEEIRAKAPLSADEAIPILDETAAGLAAAHAKGIIHRDLKPGNLFLVNESGGARYVKVLDFGLAKPAPGMDDPRERKTREGTALGTPEYMAPEQAKGKTVDTRTDLYALGVIAFELLTGRLPFTGDNPFQIAVSQVNDAPPTVRSLQPSVPVPVESLVMRLLAKNPADRPQSADLVRAELKRIKVQLSQETTLGEARSTQPTLPPADAVTPKDTPPAVAAPTTRVLRPSRTLMLSAVGLALAAAVGLGALALRPNEQPRSENVVVPLPPPEPPHTVSRSPPAELPVPEDVEPATEPTPSRAPLGERRPARPKPKAAANGALQLRVGPCTAEVFVDGRSYQWTPRPAISLAAGEHLLRLVPKPECGALPDETVMIKSGQTLTLDRRIKPK